MHIKRAIFPFGVLLCAAAGVVGVQVWYEAGRHPAAPAAQLEEPDPARTVSVAPAPTPAPPAPAHRAAGDRTAAEQPLASQSGAPLRAQTPEEEAEQQLTRLTASGPADAAAEDQARHLGQAWQRVAGAEELKVSFTDWRCYRAGCYSTMSSSDSLAIDQATERLSSIDEFSAWPGGKFRSGLMTNGNGEARVTWVLFASNG